MQTIHRLSKRALAGGAAALVAGAVGLAAPSEPAAAAEGYNRAQNALFDTNHLGGIDRPGTLVYDFHKSGTMGEPFDDTVEVIVNEVVDPQHRNLSFRFLSGPHRLAFDPVYEFKGNPLIMLFLERDVREMQDMTGGNAIYFRNRIRFEFARDPEVRPVTFTYHGEEVGGSEITIQPYVKAELRYRYPKFVAKEYTFTLSDEIPGSVYRISAVTPAKDGEGPLTEETVVFRELRAAEQKSSNKSGE